MDNTEQIPENPMIGRRIGVYELEREIGRGGMGAVYLAKRVDGEFDQTVALKLIKRGMDTDVILKRFRRERQILASLNHPNIAYFLGGGSTEEGLPYFVMEYIAGLPLYRYCDFNRLDLRERLNIFRQVCWAVQSAHEAQVIHRDLKPSNIMVKDDGKPKLLDFGIAKVIAPDFLSTEIDPTATQMRVMTPEYASPEQITGGEVGVASDIYSLGVILYELLTGHRPYRLRRQMSDDVARIIREQEPTNPSMILSREEGIVPEAADKYPSLDNVISSRGDSLEDLRRQMTGDLDRIVLKALRKKPSDRYASAGDLADDITNFLEGRPVDAEFFISMANIPRSRLSDKPSIAILPLKVMAAASGGTGDDFLGIGFADALISRLSGVQRLVVRPTSSVLGFADATALEAGRALGVDFVLDGSVRTSGDRIRVSVQLLNVAENSTRWAKAFDEDLKDVLDLEDSLSAQVVGALIPQLTADERRRLEKRGTNKPEAYEAYLRGRYFVNRFTDEHLLRAVEAFKEAIDIDPDYALPYIGLADFYIWSAIFGEISPIDGFSEAQKAARRALDIDDSMGEAYAALAFTVLVHDWNWADAEMLARRAIELSPNYPFAHECLSNFLCAQGRFDEGVVEITRAEELDPVSPRAILMTAWTLYQARDFERSIAKARKAAAMQDNFPQGLLHLGNALTAAGNASEAVEVLRKSAEMWGDSGLPRYMLCHARAAEGNLEAARKILAKILDTANRKYMSPYYIAMCCIAVGDIDDAFHWFEKAVAERNPWIVWFATEPKLDAIRNDPRYRAILDRTNNPIASPDLRREPTTGSRERSIAVLPFHLIGGHEGDLPVNEYLSIGLADALTMRLSNVRRFVVRPTSSVLQFADRETEPFTAGRELGVEFVIDGILRRVGDRIRVTAQLLDVSENSTRWAASFFENFTDVLALEDSISEQVTKQLVPHLTGDERVKLAKRGTNVPEAHDAYLQGRYFWNQFTPDSFPKAIEAFRRAVSLDPNYAMAHVGIADHYTWACIYGLYPPSEGFPKVLESASRALEIDPSLAEGHAAIGLYSSNMQKWAEAETHYRRAIELNPNYPLAHEWLSAVLVGTGRFEEGTEEVLIAERLDPLSLRPRVLSAWTIYQTRDFEHAREKALELQRRSPDFMQSHLQLANIILETGDAEQALVHARKAVELTPESPLPLYVFCFALAANDQLAEASRVIADWERQAEKMYVPPYFLGMSHLAAGNTDRALEYLEAARLEYSAWVLWYSTEPKLDRLRSDSRFRRIIDLTRLPVLR